MSRVVPLFPLYAFMAWTGKTSVIRRFKHHALKMIEALCLEGIWGTRGSLRRALFHSRRCMKVSGQLRYSTPLVWVKRASGVHWIGGWVGFRTCVNVVANRCQQLRLERWLVGNWRVLCGSTPSWLVIDFSMQCACAILSSVACPALQHFLILSLRKKKVIEYKIRVLIFSATFVGNISHSKKK